MASSSSSSPFKGDILKGQVALLTGGGSGIGYGIAEQLGRHGASISIMGRREHVVDSAVSSLISLGIPAIGIVGDVRKKDDVVKVLEATIKHFGKLDILVNAAAGNFLVPAEDLSPNGFRTVIDIDAVGTFTVCHEALKYLKKGGPGKDPSKGGLIINISATLHYTATWYQIHVSAAKAAVDSITRSLALEWGTDYDIRVNGIAPGPIGDTAGTSKLVPTEIKSSIPPDPLFKFGEKWDIAMAALYLACDAVMATVNSASAQLSMIPMLNGTNYVTWKETVEIVLGCMDLDLALRKEQPVPTTDDPKTDQIDKWERSNRMCLAIMKRTIPTGFRGSIAESTSAKKFLSEIEQYFAKNEKAETSNLLSKLVTMKYKGKGNIREYIIGMSNLAGKLKELKLELSDELLVHLVLISLPPQFGHFVVSYNTQKEKWTLNELISHCVQEEERVLREKTESAHLASSSHDKKRKRGKDSASGKPKQPSQEKQDKGPTCYFCKKAGHMKKECSKYAAWRVKKGLPVEPTAN